MLQQALDTTGDPFAFDPHTINVGSWLFFGVWCVGVLLLGLRSPPTPRLAQLGFMIVAGFLVVNKVSTGVRAVAAAARRARPPALARPAGLAGRRGLLLRLGVVVPRRRLVPTRPAATRALLGRDADPDGRGAVPRGGGGARHLRPRHDPVRVAAYPTTTRSKSVAVKRTRTSTCSPTRGTRAPDGRNSIEACMCGGSAKSRCLPSMENGDRTNPDRVQPAAGERGGAGLQRLVAGRRLEADAVGGAAADHDDVAGLGRGAAPVAEDVAALDGVHVEHGRAHRERPPVAEPEVGADAGAHREVGVVVASRASSSCGEVGDPDRAGAAAPRRRRR